MPLSKKTNYMNVKRHAKKMEKAGFKRKHVWIHVEDEARFMKYVIRLRKEHDRV